MNPEGEWVVQDLPHLRIVDDALWGAVKSRQEGLKRRWGEEALSRRPKYLLSGLIKCGHCGGGHSMVSKNLLGCSTARNKGTCNNRTNIRRADVEERVLAALRHHLLDPALYREFCEEFTREINRLRGEQRSTLDAARAEIKRIGRELERLVNLILDGEPANENQQQDAGA